MGLGLGVTLGKASKAAPNDPIADITGCVMRIESAFPETMLTADAVPAADGDMVAMMVDLSGAGNHLSQSTGIRRGVWETGVMPNGTGALDLGGFKGYSSTCDLQTTYTIFFVVHPDGVANSRALQSATKSTIFSPGRANSAVMPDYPNLVYNDLSSIANEWSVSTLGISGSASLFRLNGVDVTENSNAGGTWGVVNLAFDNFVISGEGFPGRFAALICYDRLLTAEEMERVENYLSLTYGI